MQLPPPLRHDNFTSDEIRYPFFDGILPHFLELEKPQAFSDDVISLVDSHGVDFVINTSVKVQRVHQKKDLVSFFLLLLLAIVTNHFNSLYSSSFSPSPPFQKL